MTPSRCRPWWLLLLLVFSASVSWGCDCEPGAAEWLSEARQVNREADRALADENLEEASGLLADFFSAPTPGQMAVGDVSVVLRDVAFRLAEIEVARGRYPEAENWAQQGLELGQPPDVFTANLLVVRGRAAELMGRDHEAARDYLEALRINQYLLRQILEAEEAQ